MPHCLGRQTKIQSIRKGLMVSIRPNQRLVAIWSRQLACGIVYSFEGIRYRYETIADNNSEIRNCECAPGSQTLRSNQDDFTGRPGVWVTERKTLCQNFTEFGGVVDTTSTTHFETNSSYTSFSFTTQQFDECFRLRVCLQEIQTLDSDTQTSHRHKSFDFHTHQTDRKQ